MDIDTDPAGVTAEVGHQDQETNQENENPPEPEVQPQNADTDNLPTPAIPQKRTAPDIEKIESKHKQRFYSDAEEETLKRRLLRLRWRENGRCCLVLYGYNFVFISQFSIRGWKLQLEASNAI